MAFRKKQLIFAALVLALGTAVYLNWQFSSNGELINDNAIMSTKELGEAQFVNNTPSEAPKDEDKKSDEKKEEKDKNKDEKHKGSASEYFAKAKNTRQKARDDATEMIKEILDDAKSSEETKAEAVKQASEVARRIEQESNIESLIKAKGVADCLAFIQNEECSVVVGGGGEALSDTLAVTIKDIVSGQGGISPDKIKIVQAK